jgi:hypothetical protein
VTLEELQKRLWSGNTFADFDRGGQEAQSRRSAAGCGLWGDTVRS